jgi:heparosan-N-sulfate-glucuronate 5-epimerase
MNGKLLEPYYVDFSSDGDRIAGGELGPVDAQGIPMVDYNVRYRAAGLKPSSVAPFGVHYTPVTISIYAFSLLQKLGTTGNANEVAQNDFFKLVGWMVQNLEPISAGASVWRHHFVIPFAAGIQTPYASGIAQAQGISLLLRAYQLRPDESYLAAAQRAFGAFLVDIDDGGVRSTERGFTWLEEWPSMPRSHVLNGFMFAMLAVHDYKTFFGTNEGGELWSAVVRTLEHHIDRFDAGYGSRYDLLRGLVVSETYHLLHIRLLRTVERLSNKPVFGQVADRWEKYLLQHGRLKRRALAFRDNTFGNSEYRACKLRQLGHLLARQ